MRNRLAGNCKSVAERQKPFTSMRGGLQPGIWGSNQLGLRQQLVQVTKAVRANLHHMRGKERILLDEELEAALVEFGHAGRFASNDREEMA
jgi:hypothetical protein